MLVVDWRPPVGPGIQNEHKYQFFVTEEHKLWPIKTEISTELLIPFALKKASN